MSEGRKTQTGYTTIRNADTKLALVFPSLTKLPGSEQKGNKRLTVSERGNAR